MYIVTATPHHIASLRKQVEVDRRARTNATWRPAFVFLPATDDYFVGGETYAPIGAYVQFYVENGDPQVEAVHDVILINDHIQRRGGHFNLQWADAEAKRAFDIMLAEWRVEMAEFALGDAEGELEDAATEAASNGTSTHRFKLADLEKRKAQASLDAARAELARLQAEPIDEKGDPS